MDDSPFGNGFFGEGKKKLLKQLGSRIGFTGSYGFQQLLFCASR